MDTSQTFAMLYQAVTMHIWMLQNMLNGRNDVDDDDDDDDDSVYTLW